MESIKQAVKQRLYPAGIQHATLEFENSNHPCKEQSCEDDLCKKIENGAL